MIYGPFRGTCRTVSSNAPSWSNSRLASTTQRHSTDTLSSSRRRTMSSERESRRERRVKRRERKLNRCVARCNVEVERERTQTGPIPTAVVTAVQSNLAGSSALHLYRLKEHSYTYSTGFCSDGSLTVFSALLFTGVRPPSLYFRYRPHFVAC